MKKFFLLLLFCHVSSSVKHSLKYFLTTSSGIPNFPELIADVQVDDVQAIYCNANTKTVEPKQDWMKKYFDKDTGHLEWYKSECSENWLNVFKTKIADLMQQFNQSEGVHVLQRIHGCEWDEETGEITTFMQYGYDGEDFISLDLKTLTWIALKPEAVIIKLRWDADKLKITHDQIFLTLICPAWLKKYVDHGNSSLLRTALPSVSLLQKTPSSPVSCHATGFYPDRAMMFWRKDGEELHEDVDRGEILPNHDGTFQMSVDLKVSSIPSKDWRRYDCVFNLSGVKEDIITKLDKAGIRTNATDMTPFIIAVVAVLAVVIVITACGFFIYKKKNAKRPPSPVSNPEVMEQLNPSA
ncbi:major histocompatibility complex class I-related gene protein [Lates calcarifer]|uniref:Major histocompatibility complex class I-related gene protein n=1 Tax=Lates calcarifer TaxID=8187 RepID=A0AAJ7PSQ1_LATCA|nr:major histocompatibility complex class I-related gene protein [Lates calcarifer]